MWSGLGVIGESCCFMFMVILRLIRLYATYILELKRFCIPSYLVTMEKPVHEDPTIVHIDAVDKSIIQNFQRIAVPDSEIGDEKAGQADTVIIEKFVLDEQRIQI